MTKKNQYLLTIVVTLISTALNAQTINWNSFERQDRHIIHASVGAEHGTVFGIGYGHHFTAYSLPVVVGAEYSMPAGNQLCDDFKTKVGGQVRVVKYRNFQASARVQGVFRRYQNSYSRMLNFGSDMGAVGGYYRKRWFAAAEFGFDKAIVTHFKHSVEYRSNYEGAVDGWYEPSIGGNFYYGVQTGYTVRKHDISIRAGRMVTQDFRTKPAIPFYGQLGYNMRF